VSSVPAVKAALVTVLTAALPASQVIYGPIESVSITTPRVLSVEGAVGTRDMSNLALTIRDGELHDQLLVSVAAWLPATDRR
jgi:hypothetical protein